MNFIVLNHNLPNSNVFKPRNTVYSRLQQMGHAEVKVLLRFSCKRQVMPNANMPLWCVHTPYVWACDHQVLFTMMTDSGNVS